VVIRLIPELVERFYRSIAEEITTSEEESVAPPKAVSASLKLVNETLKDMLSTFLGQIIDPRWNLPQFRDRACQIIEAMLEYYRKSVKLVIERIREKRLEGMSIERELEKLDSIETIISIASREIINRLYTLMTINAPAEARPPLANVRLGYEKVRA